MMFGDKWTYCFAETSFHDNEPEKPFQLQQKYPR